MKKVRTMKGLMIIVMFTLIFTACAKKDNSYDRVNYSKGTDESKADYDYDQGDNGAAAPGEATSSDSYDMIEQESIKNSSSITSNPQFTNTMEKIIRKVNMDVETQDFDELMDTMNEDIADLGGYVESSDISGKSYNYNNSLRRAHIIARIPKDNLNDFIGKVYETSNVVNKSENTENVTLEYVNTESRKKALEIEQERLFVLLEKTDSLENIITLESRLSSIRYELQNYETRLRTIDNEVEYSTVTLSIDEVERMTPKKEEKITVMNRIKNGLSDTMYDITEGLKDFIVDVSINLPYIIIWAIIITIGVLISRRYYKKYKKKLQGPSEKPNNNSEQNKE